MFPKLFAYSLLRSILHLCLAFDVCLPSRLSPPAGHRAELAQLPDAQRREAAAGIVMQLLEAMGLSDEGEEGSDEETG